MKQSRHLFLNYSFPGRGGRRNQRRATNWRKVGGCTRKTFYSIRRRNIRWDPYLYLEITFFSFFFFSKEAKPISRSCLYPRTNESNDVLSTVHPLQTHLRASYIFRWIDDLRTLVKLWNFSFVHSMTFDEEETVCEENKAKRKCACRYFAWIDECDRWRGKEKKKKKEKRNVGRIGANLGNMGSSNKARKHYKKDSRFVTDLYTFTYDDFDLVRFKWNVNTTEWRVSPFHLIERLITFTK